MFRPASIIPIFLSIAAFILSLLVLLAGYKESFLPSVYVLKVDTTNLGVNLTDINVDSTLSRFGLDDNTSNTISRFLDDRNITSKIDSRIQEKLDDLVDTAARRLGVADVYVAHMMTFCEGYVEGSETSNKTKILACTKPKLPYAFDPLDEIEQRLAEGAPTLEQLGIQTDNVEDVINALQVAYKAMSITLVIGTALAGLSILMGLLGLTASRLVEVCNGLVAWVGFLMLGVAAAIATAIAVKGRDVFNEYARDAGVRASESKPLMGMIWAAVAAMLLAALWWSFTCCCGRHGRKAGRRDEPLVEKTRPVGGPRRRRFGGFGGMFGRRRRSNREVVV